MSLTGVIAFLLSLYAIWFLYQQQTVCVQCNGRGRHRRDCPLHDDSDTTEP